MSDAAVLIFAGFLVSRESPSAQAGGLLFVFFHLQVLFYYKSYLAGKVSFCFFGEYLNLFYHFFFKVNGFFYLHSLRLLF